MFCKLTGLVEMQVGAVIFDALFALLVEAEFFYTFIVAGHST